MTRDEWNATMSRWLHRSDITADLDTVWALTVELVSARWMRTEPPYPSAEEWLAATPRPFVHGGLVHLHELAQDEAGLGREQDRFERAVQDEALAWSLANVVPQMAPAEEE